jgi:hypothetical protein
LFSMIISSSPSSSCSIVRSASLAGITVPHFIYLRGCNACVYLPVFRVLKR